MPRKNRNGAKGEGGDDTAKIKKSKSFKRIRGFLNGETRKEKKARKAAERAAKAAAGLPVEDNDEASTIFGVDVDERSTLTGGAGAADSTAASFLNKEGGNSLLEPSEKKAYILKVVLLLMDPDTRRFELLQLEFDSLKALVSDVLAQIPVSVTEEALRLQSYTGIAGKDGIPMAPTKLLASFCNGNEVLVAIPQGVPPKDCARLARPILSDDKVVNMLASSGIDASGWKEDPKKKKKKSAMKSRSMEAAEPLNPTKGTNKTFVAVFVVLLVIILQVFHIYIAAPIKPGSTISPGVWLSKCGLLTMLPSCQNAYLHFDRKGTLTHYNAAKQVTWQVDGATCEVGDEGCTAGLKIEEDGKVIIGGKTASYATSFVKEAQFTPWPFTEMPKLKLWRK